MTRRRVPARAAAAAAALALCAGAGGPAIAQVRWSGGVQTQVGVKLRDCTPDECPLLDYDNVNTVELTADADLGRRAASRVRLDVRNRNAPALQEIEDHGDTDKVQPVDLRVQEAWVEGYDVIFSGLDVRIGAQRIVWGTADGYSPTDRLNPYDLEDPTHFDRRLAVPAVHARWTLGVVTASAAWMPVFVPARLPTRELDLTEGFEDPNDIVDMDPYIEGGTPDLGELDTRTRLPSRSLTESAVGLRLAWEASFGDLAVGYYRGRDSLPQLSGEVVPVGFEGNDAVNVVVNLRYPRLQLATLDFRGPLVGDVSWWLDGAVVFPSRTVAFVTANRLRDLERLRVIDSAPAEDVIGETQSGDPYVTGVVGVDTTLPGDIYANVQYLRGFLLERDGDELHNYALVALRYPSVGGAWRVEGRGGAEVSDGGDEVGWIAQGRFTILHGDQLSAAAVVLVQGGDDGTTFYRFRNLSEARIELGAEF